MKLSKGGYTRSARVQGKYQDTFQNSDQPGNWKGIYENYLTGNTEKKGELERMIIF